MENRIKILNKTMYDIQRIKNNKVDNNFEKKKWDKNKKRIEISKK